MIGDYLDGKRIPFFPPVKMLFVLCVFYALLSPLMERGDTHDTQYIQTATVEDTRQQIHSAATAQDKEELEKLKLEKIAVDTVGFVKSSLE